MSSPITISQWPDDVRAAPDEGAAADGDDRIGRHLLPRRHAGRDGSARPDDRLGPDVDQMLVVESALGEQQARAGAHAPEAAAPGGRRGRSRRDRPHPPGRVHQPGQGPPQRCREGAGPTHARMVGGVADPPSPLLGHVQREVAGNVGPCSPSHRTVARRPRTPCRSRDRPIDRRQFLQLSALGAAGFAGATRLERTHSKQRVPAKAKRATRGTSRSSTSDWRAGSRCPQHLG